MSPVENSTSGDCSSVPPGSYQLVAWDLDTTGRRLIDEICQIGGYYLPIAALKNDKKSDSANEDVGQTFSQYVMPHKNPNPGARRSFGIRVVNIGRYRMLKDMSTGKILKTKSEVSALQEFLEWLTAAKAESDGVILVCHEPNRKVLVPLLLEALYKYNLMEQFKKTVVGFVNGVSVVAKYGDKSKITSNSLRSLCKTVLSDTNPLTTSASDRSKVLTHILSALNENENAERVTGCAVTVASEEEELRSLKGILGTQGTLRPIFESQLRQKRSVRERAMALRKLLAESGLDYRGIEDIYRAEKPEIRKVLSTKIKACDDNDMDELIALLNSHFVKEEVKQEVEEKKNGDAGQEDVETGDNKDKASGDK